MKNQTQKHRLGSHDQVTQLCLTQGHQAMSLTRHVVKLLAGLQVGYPPRMAQVSASIMLKARHRAPFRGRVRPNAREEHKHRLRVSPGSSQVCQAPRPRGSPALCWPTPTLGPGKQPQTKTQHMGLPHRLRTLVSPERASGSEKGLGEGEARAKLDVFPDAGERRGKMGSHTGRCTGDARAGSSAQVCRTDPELEPPPGFCSRLWKALATLILFLS